jgi:hypothetical protein
LEFLKSRIPCRISRSLKNAALGVAGSASLLVFSEIPSAKALPETGPAFGFNKAPTELKVNDPPFVLGYHFTTDFDRKLVRLGIYKPTQTGGHLKSVDDHSVGIWDFTPPKPTLIWQQQFLKSENCAEDTTYFCWYDISNGPQLTRNVDYVAAATWGDEFSPVEVPKEDVDILVKGFKLMETAATQQGAVPDLLIELDAKDYYAPTINTAPQKGFMTVNLSFETLPTVQTPGPLPLIGAAAAFGWSRKIRRRINKSI